MRAVLLAFAALLVCAAPAAAQKAPEAGALERPRPPAPPPSEPERIAARDMLTAFILESGIMDAVLEEAVAEHLPELRAHTADPALLAEIGPERMADLNAFVETLPSVIREEVQRVIPTVIDASTPEVAALFTEAEMTGITAFLRQEETRRLLVRIVQTGADGLSEREIELAVQFGRTPAGRAFIRHTDALSSALEAALLDATPALMAALSQRVYRGMCDALGDACPPSIRSQLAPI